MDNINATGINAEYIDFEFILDQDGLMAFDRNKQLQKTEQFLNANYIIVDWEGIRIILAAAAALYVPGEMLWLRDIGPSRSGKTEILRAISQHGDSGQMEVLTPAALRGGLKEQKTKLLTEIKGKRVITLDMASLLTTRKDFRNEVFGLLRLAKDGRLSSDFGSMEGHLELETKFDWIVATTPYFEQYRTLEGLLGERFIDLWWRPAEREIMAIQAVENNPKLVGIRKDLANLVDILLDNAKAESSHVNQKNIDKTFLGQVADLTALLRSPVAKDYQGAVISTPTPEYGTDIAQSFQKIALGLQLLRVKEYERYIKRLVRDCIPSVRRVIISSLLSAPATQKTLSENTKLPVSTVRYHLIDLEALSVVTKEDVTENYALADNLKEKINKAFTN